MPKVDRKLSLGFAKVAGGPKDFVGVNIRTETGERQGDDRRGPKASGMLFVDGVLTMLVRNTGNAQLAWSEDYARTWRWSDWKFETSFGVTGDSQLRLNDRDRGQPASPERENGRY